jgi:CheY-like chemotaxis protein
MSQYNQISRRSRSPSSRGATRAADPPPAPLRVLLLDDDADTCEAFESLLCPEDGFEMRTTGTVHACVEWLRLASATGRPYDVLLLDLALPGGHWGTEVLEAAQHDPEMSLPAVVVCTALSGAYLEA